MIRKAFLAVTALALGVSAVTAAFAQNAPTAAGAAKGPASWWDTFKFSGHLEAGITGNPDDPKINFGHLFTDRANTVLLNQLLLTVERPIDPKSPTYDFGFRFQVMYGSDARYTHFLGEFDRSIHRRNQFDIVEANLQAHLPWLTPGGIDVKGGQYPTLEGAEIIDPTGNFFYSHSYIFNFGVPLKHTGILTTTHVNPVLDIYAGFDTGVNTSAWGGDNNDKLAFHGGFGLNLLGGAVTAVASTHIGPENPKNTPGVSNSALRYLNDIYVIWKINDKLTSTTDLNFIRDDGFDASGGGAAQYLTYTINDLLSVGGRIEVWRDGKGFFVAAFPGNLDFVNLERGRPATAIGGGKTTYGELTLGLNIKPTVPLVKTITIRPEIRVDHSLNGTRPYDNGTDRSQVTLAADLIVPF